MMNLKLNDRIAAENNTRKLKIKFLQQAEDYTKRTSINLPLGVSKK